MGGAIIGRAELIDAMRDDVGILGPTLDPHAAFLLQRGMKTYFVRWDAQCRNARRVAEHLARHPRVERVRYPGLHGIPAHALALPADARLRHDRHVRRRGRLDAGSRFCRSAANCSAITASLGSTESLVVPPALQQPRGMTAEQQRWTDIGPGTVRLSIGLEDIDDLHRGPRPRARARAGRISRCGTLCYAARKAGVWHQAMDAAGLQDRVSASGTGSSSRGNPARPIGGQHVHAHRRPDAGAARRWRAAMARPSIAARCAAQLWPGQAAADERLRAAVAGLRDTVRREAAPSALHRQRRQRCLRADRAFRAGRARRLPQACSVAPGRPGAAPVNAGRPRAALLVELRRRHVLQGDGLLPGRHVDRAAGGAGHVRAAAVPGLVDDRVDHSGGDRPADRRGAGLDLRDHAARRRARRGTRRHGRRAPAATAAPVDRAGHRRGRRADGAGHGLCVVALARRPGRRDGRRPRPRWNRAPVRSPCCRWST